MTEPVVLTSIAGGVCTIAMNRPKALNALNRELTLALREAVFAAEQNKDVRCVVLKGGEHFMAGGDLKWFHENLAQYPPAEIKVIFEGFIHEVHAMIISIRRMPKPVIASVSGAAAGFGLSLALACDLTVAADTSYFTLAYALIGVTPDGGSTYSLARLVGAKKAAEIALLADRFDAATAERLGLVNKVVPAAELDAATAKLAARLASGPTAVYGRTKALLQRSLDNPLEAQLQREAEAFTQCATEPDFAEGIRAFIEKRKPNFKGA
jgi:2-(1,2-epoxy-1,2-dihydrophenyl)acetyl-CoA isomerase